MIRSLILLLAFLIPFYFLYSFPVKSLSDREAALSKSLVKKKNIATQIIQGDDIFDFGGVKAGTLLEREFVFKEKIVKTIANCSCLKTRITAKSVILAVDTTGERGRFEKFLYIETEKKQYKILIRGSVLVRKKFIDSIIR